MINRLALFVLITITQLSSADSFPQSTFDNLDYGLYWSGPNSQYEKAGAHTANGSQFYDPAKPTLIYVHGWADKSSTTQTREDFNNTRNGRPDVDFAAMWRNHGYNIGIMYWNQFSDEAEVKDAEAKIWSATGRKGMRWRNSQGIYATTNSRSNVSDLLVHSYITAMTQYAGNDIRIAGHSLGNQLAIKMTHMLKQEAQSGLIPANIVPDRVSLLDSFYSKYAKDYLNGRWNSGVAKDMVVELKNYGTAIDSYRSSSITTTEFAGDKAIQLHNEVAFVEMGSKFFYWWDIGRKHISATWMYLWSIDSPMPHISNSSYSGISAATPNWIIRDWMYSNRRAVQSHGLYSKTPADNKFTTKGRL